MSTRNCDQAIDVKVMMQGFRWWGDLEENLRTETAEAIEEAMEAPLRQGSSGNTRSKN